MVERKLLLIGVLLMLGVGWSSGLKCYQCNSCESPFNASSSRVSICEGRSCFNYKFIIQNKHTGTNKGCLETGSGLGFSCSTRTVNGDGLTNCTCLSDLCNGAPISRLHFAIFVAVLGCFIQMTSH